MTNRVVVTGLGALSPVGTSWERARECFQDGMSGVQAKPKWGSIEGIESLVAGEVDRSTEDLRDRYDPRDVRSMGRAAVLAMRSTEIALREAGLWESSELGGREAGVAFGSTEGCEEATYKFFDRIVENDTISGIKMADFIQRMPHSLAANLASSLELGGRLIPTSSACTSGSQGVGYGYEAIREGKQNLMITGGAEELVKSAAAVFNVMMGASTYNDAPETTPRPFDESRDGLVVAEGCGTVVLESLDHARRRNAPILAEVVGFDTNTNAGHTTIPSREGIRDVMRGALDSAGIGPSKVDYISAHATATRKGDVAESNSTESIFGDGTPVSSLKGYMGHTLGGCGAIEVVYGIRMLNQGWFAPTLNLSEVDEDCGELDYIRDHPREIDAEYIVSNNFAFGGVNTSLVIKRWHD